MPCKVPAVFARSPLYLEKLLETRPRARIIHIISHEKRHGFHPVLKPDGSEHLDEFGYPVYLARDIDWFGDMGDIDERYSGTGYETTDTF